MSIDMDKLKDKLGGNGGGGGDSDDVGWFKMETGNKYKIRFLPDPDEEGDPLKKVRMHYGVHPDKYSFVCPYEFGEDCPFCEKASELFDKYEEEGNKEAQKMARKLNASKRFYSAIIDRSDEKLKWYSYSKTVCQEIIDTIKDPEYGDVTDPAEGFDFKIDYKEGSQYPETSIRPSRSRSKALDDLDKVEEYKERAGDIYDRLMTYEQDEVQEFYRQYIHEAGYESDDMEKYGDDEGPSDDVKDVEDAVSSLRGDDEEE